MFFRRKPTPAATPALLDDPLDQVLLAFSEADPFTIRDACQGVQIFGETGSGKTSGSGRLFATSYLRAGFGGLVLTANPDDAEQWRQYAKETGRTEDLIFFGPDHAASFNFLHYEQLHGTRNGDLTRNLVDLFQTISEIGESNASKGGMNEGYWQKELHKLLSNAIDLLRFAGASITLEMIHEVILSAPKSEAELDDLIFQLASTCYKLGRKIVDEMTAGKFNDRDARDAALTMSYWEKEFPNLDMRPRGSIVGSFTGMADVFLRGRFRELFGAETTIRPEQCFDGKIIVLDMPVKRFKAMGTYGQVVFKYCWQKAVERRAVSALSRPVFLWADEAQYFVNSHDALFQTTARSSRVCTVYLTQNIPNYQHRFDQISGSGAALTNSLLGNLATKIFHSNTCAVTNRYASELFAKEWVIRESQSTSFTDEKGSYGTNRQPELQDTILPREFSGMRSGGPENDFLVEAIVNKAGRRFHLSGTNALRVVFQQHNTTQEPT